LPERQLHKHQRETDEQQHAQKGDQECP
jgi:hypothetical protein